MSGRVSDQSIDTIGGDVDTIGAIESGDSSDAIGRSCSCPYAGEGGGGGCGEIDLTNQMSERISDEDRHNAIDILEEIDSSW
jgi:hypothetical protein